MLGIFKIVSHLQVRGGERSIAGEHQSILALRIYVGVTFPMIRDASELELTTKIVWCVEDKFNGLVCESNIIFAVKGASFVFQTGYSRTFTV